MKDEIAVIVDRENKLTDIFKGVNLSIYRKETCWEKTKVVKLKPFNPENEEEIRAFISNLQKELDRCKCIVGTVIIGMPYFLLSRAGYELLEAEELSTELLDQIYEDYIIQKEEELPTLDKPNIEKHPIKLNEQGEYFLDFITLQKAYPEISSKKALVPFFNHTPYKKITILCPHIMPWLERYVDENKLKLYHTVEDGKCKVIITNE